MATNGSGEAPQSTVIIGAGIIGCATAYYLSTSGNTDPKSIHLVEASPELFASASGKAGGFCTSDWFGPPTASLGALSFRLHQELADKHDGYKTWGYCRSTASSFMEGSQPARSFEGSNGEDWLSQGGSRAQEAGVTAISDEGGAPSWLTRGRGSQSEVIGEIGGVAQVDPLRLSQFLLKHSISQGAHLHHPAKPVRLRKDESGALAQLEVSKSDGTTDTISCTRLLITSGAWTPSVFRTLFPASRLKLGVQPLAGYSLIVRSPRLAKQLDRSGCHAIFTSMRGGVSPELFSRIGGEAAESEIYIAGLNDASLPLPELASNAKIEQDSNAELHRITQKLLGRPGAGPSDLEILKEGLCFRPVTRNGVPILAKVPDDKLGDGIKTSNGADGGVFVAAGHGPWGISHSLGTGKVMAEMLERAKLSADVRRLGLQ